MENIIIPKILKDSEKFDIESFKNEMDSISGKRTLSNKEFYLEQETQSSGYISRKYLNGSYFMVSKKYYENGNIKQKSVSFNNGYPINSIYEFSEDGKLIEEIDMDKGYDFGWEAIIKYCDENDIKLTKGYI